MSKKLFSNNIFKVIFIIIVGIDLFGLIMRISEHSPTTSVTILRYVNLSICLIALFSFFIITNYSLSILKLYIVFRLIIYPIFIFFTALKYVLFYSVNRFDIEVYFSMSLILILGLILYFLFNKFKIKEEINA